MNGTDVGLMLRLTDNELTRSMWDFPFEAMYEVILSHKKLTLRLRVANPGDKTFPFTAALHPYFSVMDVVETPVNVVGLEGLTYFDKGLDAGKVRVREEKAEKVTFDGRCVDRVYVDSPVEVGLNVGSGASILISNKEGFKDTIVWNPGKDNIGYGLWRYFVCVESGRVARPVKLPPQQMWEGVCELTLNDEEEMVFTEREMFARNFEDKEQEEQEESKAWQE